MNNPRIIKRKRDEVYAIEYCIKHKRKVKSLGTRDKIEAGVKYSYIAGYLAAESWSAPKVTTRRQLHHLGLI